MVERALQIANAAVIHVKSITAARKKEGSKPNATAQQRQKMPSAEQEEAVAGMTARSLLEGIHVMRVHDHTEQLAAIQHIPDFIRAHPQVKLVVIDSIAFHLRHGINDFGTRGRILSLMSNKLQELANRQSAAVVVINQMTTKVDGASQDSAGHGRLIPALGETWAHAATHRIQLFWQSAALATAASEYGGADGAWGGGGGPPVRCARLIKSSCRAEKTVAYEVNEKGIRDLPRAPAAKRQRTE